MGGQPAARRQKQATGEAAAAFRDRIVGLKRVKASDLRKNPKNWRLHPENQRGALQSVLKEVGFVDALIAREIDGGLELINGHLRADIAEDADVPVLIVDLNAKEAAKILATFDPLGTLALIDGEAFASLVSTVDLDGNAELRHMIAGLQDELEAEEESGPKPHDVPGMALQPHEHYDYLVVLATTTHEWNVLCEGSMHMRNAIRGTKSKAYNRLVITAEMISEGAFVLLPWVDPEGAKPSGTCEQLAVSVFEAMFHRKCHIRRNRGALHNPGIR